MKFLIYAFAVILLFSCKKKRENPCKNALPPIADFVTKEVIGDTAFTTDTIFNDNPVKFQSLQKYNSVTWKVGDDARSFTNPEFQLTFFDFIETISVSLTATRNPNTACFPSDNGNYTATKKFTLVEQFDRLTLTKSPLIGKYKGAFTDKPSDTFTVRLEYFDSSKYRADLTGNRNFYYFSNFPKGIVNTGTAAYVYPELQSGFRVEMGYKAFVFDFNSTTGINGNAWLSNDTLFIISGNNVTGRRRFIGKKL